MDTAANDLSEVIHGQQRGFIARYRWWMIGTIVLSLAGLIWLCFENMARRPMSDAELIKKHQRGEIPFADFRVKSAYFRMCYSGSNPEACLRLSRESDDVGQDLKNFLTANLFAADEIGGNTLRTLLDRCTHTPGEQRVIIDALSLNVPTQGSLTLIDLLILRTMGIDAEIITRNWRHRIGDKRAALIMCILDKLPTSLISQVNMAYQSLGAPNPYRDRSFRIDQIDFAGYRDLREAILEWLQQR